MGEFGSSRDYSEGVAVTVDAEVRAIMEQAHNEAYHVLNANRAVLDRLAAELLEKETLDHLQVAEIFKDVVKLPPRKLWLSSEGRPVSDLPPIEVPLNARTDAPQAAPASPATETDGPAEPGPGASATS